jgi:pyruvate dehydrogenase E2 component (dihydrolipoamide acetyltransferase)
MPRLSDTMLEGTVSKWLKRPGEPVQRGEVLAQIETDKATMDLQAYDSGTLQEILVDEGATVPIGQPIARSEAAGAAGGRARGGRPAAEETAAERPAPRPGRPEAPGPADRAPVSQGRPERPAPPTADGAAAGKVRASPVARRMAEEHGLDLAGLQGTGPEGRVIRADVESALAARPAPAAAAPAQRAPVAAGPEQEEQRTPLSAMRRTIARRMAESTRTIPHFFLTTTVDATELMELRRQLLQQFEASGEDTKVSVNDLIVRAAALALRRVPEVNVSFAEDAIIRHGQVNVGIAVALENGLIVPVLRAADQKSVGQIARETRDLAERARAGKLQPADYSGGTFTISNLGMFGVEQFNAVINPPEAAILAVGAVVREPVEYRGEIALRDRMKLTMSIDHRALDGATGARYLKALKALLEQPLLLLV